jgi:processive 1,2-diacylglycerol beta-glucosyltransferase
MAADTPGIIPFGFTSEVPTLMAASDLVVTLPGATTCSEARVMGRPVLLLDVMPGHGRDNLMHELEQGDANVCCSTPEGIAKSARALLDTAPYPMKSAASPPHWRPSVIEALQLINIDLHVRQPEMVSPSMNGNHRTNGARPVTNGASA